MSDNSLRQLPIVRALLASENPSVRYGVRTRVLGEPEGTPDLLALRASIADGAMARALLGHRLPDGTLDTGTHVDGTRSTNAYNKWQGPLWTLVSLALIDYPAGDAELHPIRDQVYTWLLEPAHLQYPRSLLIPGQEERFRRCAGQEAYTLWATLRLGIADERTDELARRLLRWQWPDGGWNCDKRPEAHISSFHETLMPMRALHYHGGLTGDQAASQAARRAAEVFLERRLFRRRRDGALIDPQFLLTTWPYFYHYNILTALLGMAELGLVRDPRCAEALDLLQAKRLPDGGYPNERRVYTTSAQRITRGSYADWGPVGKRVSNPFVTVDALRVLLAAGRSVA